MKRLLLLLVLFPMMACAQRVDKPGEPYDYYVTIRGRESVNGKFKAEIQFPGQYYFKNIADISDGNTKLSTLTDIFLFMAKRGWELSCSYPGDGVVRFIFKKKVSSDKEAEKDFNIGESFKEEREQ